MVQSYRAKAAKSSKNIEAFGESEPVATIEGQKSYTVELTRLYATDTAISDGIDFYNLTDFSLVICKPDRKVIYSGCEWSGIQEDGELNATVAETGDADGGPAHRDYGMRTVDALKPLTAGELLELWQYVPGEGVTIRWNGRCCATPPFCGIAAIVRERRSIGDEAGGPGGPDAPARWKTC